MPAETVVYLPTQLGTSNTWLPFSYTQTFPAVPDQLPSPGSGEIGYGTLTKNHKRDEPTAPAAVEARETGIAGRFWI